VWSPCNITAVKKIEAVQRRFTERLPSLNKLSYQERLSSLRLDSLQIRRIKAYLLHTYKIMFRYVDTDKDAFFKLVDSAIVTRGHNYKLYANYSRVDARKHFFCNRIVKTWNSLKAQPDDFASFNSLKRFINAIVIAQDRLFIIN